MSLGYTLKVAETIKNADGNLVGVQLGRICLERGITVPEAANTLGVTRQTVYHWFCGETIPKPCHEAVMQAWLAQLTEATED